MKSSDGRSGLKDDQNGKWRVGVWGKLRGSHVKFCLHISPPLPFIPHKPQRQVSPLSIATFPACPLTRLGVILWRLLCCRDFLSASCPQLMEIFWARGKIQRLFDHWEPSVSQRIAEHWLLLIWRSCLARRYTLSQAPRQKAEDDEINEAHALGSCLLLACKLSQA